MIRSNNNIVSVKEIGRYNLSLQLLITSLLLVFCCIAYPQTTDSTEGRLTIKLSIRPRAEYRNNYVWNNQDTVLNDLLFTQRNRITITYEKKHFKIHGSLQEIHIWGKKEKFSAIGSINMYELYGESMIAKNTTVRIGRQALSLDNGRLFSTAPWAQQSRSHEGVRILYNKKLDTDLMIGFTRNYSSSFDAAYSPTALHKYKMLFVHHLKYAIGNNYHLTTINAADFFAPISRLNKYNTRITSGGRITYTKDNFYFTLSAYYQYGKNETDEKISAYYMQPEFSLNRNRTTIRLGAEVLSGEKSLKPKNTGSFVPLYGVAWKFMGNMNLFTKFPIDVQNRGLINPYLFLLYNYNTKVTLRADAHLFYSQYNFTNSNINSHYLGFESDLSLNYIPTKNIEINFGFSFLLPQKNITSLHKIKNTEHIPTWTYLMISYHPVLWKYQKKKRKSL